MSPGPTQLIIVLVIVLLLFGAKKIPELAKGLGTGMREFREGASGAIEDDDKNEEPESKSAKGESSKDSGGTDVRSEDETSDEKASKTQHRS